MTPHKMDSRVADADRYEKFLRMMGIVDMRHCNFWSLRCPNATVMIWRRRPTCTDPVESRYRPQADLRMRAFRRDSSRDKESGHEQHVSTTCCKAAAGSVLIDERAIGNELDRRLVSRDRLNTAQHRARESARHGTSIRVCASGMRCTSLPCRRAGSRSPSSCRKYAAYGCPHV